MTLPKLQGWVQKVRHPESEVSRDPLPFIVGAVTGICCIGLFWVVTSALPSDSHDDQSDSIGAQGAEPSPAVGSTRAPAHAAAGAGPRTGVLASCRQVFAGQGAVLRTVPEPLSQWQVHIGAMNKLVTGVITLKQATEFWDQTRVGAAHNLARYRAAHDAFAGRTVRCPHTGGETALSEDARTCSKSVAARGRELAKADRALHTWRVHVRHMEMLRMGKMTPAEATRQWLKSWHAGVKEVADYRQAARHASDHAC